LTISGLIYFVFKSPGAFFVSLAGGILIDLDHVYDYYLQEGMTLNIKKIYSWCAEKKHKTIHLFLHSIEFIFMLWACVSLFKLGIFWIAFAVGLTQHIILDILANQIYPYAYFFSYRFIKGFRTERLIKI